MRIVYAIPLVIFALIGCGCRRSPTKPLKNQNLADANAVLTKVGRFAEDSFYSCLLNGYTQGLSPAQARDECATQLLADDKKGFGGAIGNIRPGSESFFDPSKITAACNPGDPTRGQTSNSSGLGYGKKTEFGQYTYGGNPNSYYGLVKEDSEKMKNEAIKEADDEYNLFEELRVKAEEAEKELNAAKATGDQQAIDKAKVKSDEANKKASEQAGKALDARKKAREDPNKKPPQVGRTVDGGSPCEQALQSARELLRECHRTQWKDFRCQQLQASVNGCPDPALILVDPDQGYSCGAKLDPEAVKNAWVAKCQQRVKVMPGTANPCSPPTFDATGRFGQGKTSDICDNPRAQTDPDNDECSTVTIGKEFGEINIQEIIVVALNMLGGPIVVIPTNPNPPPRPGADPRPVPR